MQATRRGRMGDLYAAIATGNIVRVREFVTREPGLANAATETPPPLHWALYDKMCQRGTLDALESEPGHRLGSTPRPHRKAPRPGKDYRSRFPLARNLTITELRETTPALEEVRAPIGRLLRSRPSARISAQVHPLRKLPRILAEYEPEALATHPGSPPEERAWRRFGRGKHPVALNAVVVHRHAAP